MWILAIVPLGVMDVLDSDLLLSCLTCDLFIWVAYSLNDYGIDDAKDAILHFFMLSYFFANKLEIPPLATALALLEFFLGYPLLPYFLIYI